MPLEPPRTDLFDLNELRRLVAEHLAASARPPADRDEATEDTAVDLPAVVLPKPSSSPFFRRRAK